MRSWGPTQANPDGTPNPKYGAASKPRFDRLIIDACTRLPADDMGIHRAVRAGWELDILPTVNDVQKKATAWAYRTYAATLLWRSLAPAGMLSDRKARALSREASLRKVAKEAGDA